MVTCDTDIVDDVLLFDTEAVDVLPDSVEAFILVPTTMFHEVVRVGNGLVEAEA